MRIMITGGGTGGHTSPATAVFEELQKRDPQLRVQWVGCPGRIEEDLSKRLGIPFRALPVAGWPRRRGPRQLWVALKLAYCLARAAVLIRAFRPQLVFGVGGYVSLPLMWTAQWMGVPTVLHEQNRRLGMANRLLAPRATRIFLSFESTLGDFPEERSEVVGNPVRQEFVDPPAKSAARAALGLHPDGPVLLVCGGSQGARQINDAVATCLEGWVSQGIQLLWASGAQGHESARAAASGYEDNVRVFEYITDMASACAAADVVVGRAGASTTAELAALGRPCILVPYPLATDNHQYQNARAFEDAGAGCILEDKDCTGPALEELVSTLLEDRDKLEMMARQARGLAKVMASEHISEAIMRLVFNDSIPDQAVV